MKVVVVESPAKAKTINKYLGPGYEVIASFGHIRDLPAKDGSVEPEQDFSMLWEIDPKASKRVSEIASAVKGFGGLILATDPDREGEAISWHILEALAPAGVEGRAHRARHLQCHYEGRRSGRDGAPRQIDQALVDAYLARRALDYLVGFRLSPVLWRKLPERVPPAASSPSLYGSSATGSARSSPSFHASTGTCSRRWPPLPEQPSTHASLARTEPRSPGSTSGRPTRPKVSRQAVWRQHVFQFPIDRGQAGPPQPLPALYNLHASAGGQPQARHGAGPHHAGGAEAL